MQDPAQEIQDSAQPEQSTSSTTEEALAAAIARYREVVASAPDLVSGMVRGDTIEEIDASAEAARRAYAGISRRVRESYEQQMREMREQIRVPTGNPARSSSTPAAEHLRPEAKIALGLRVKRET